MNWRHLLRQVYRGLLQHKLRSLLSTLGIVFAVVAVVSMLSIAEGAKRETLEQIEQLGMKNIIVRALSLTQAQQLSASERLSRGLNESDVASLRSGLPTVSHVAPLKEVQAATSASDREGLIQILGVTEAYRSVNDLSLREGRFIHALDVENRSLVCVLGVDAARIVGSEGRLGGSLRIEDQEYRVVGILEERRRVRNTTQALAVRRTDRAAFIPLGTGPPLKGRSEELSEILVQVAHGNDVRAAAAVVDRILARNHGGVRDFQIVIPQELLTQARRTQRTFNIVLGCIAGISLVVGGIGIMNIMLASVAERTREIGIRRSIGASREHIVVQFLCESVLLTIAGGCLGVVLGVGGALTIGTLAGWRTVLTFWSIAISMIMALGVGILSGLYPALKASQLDPIVALRYE